MPAGGNATRTNQRGFLGAASAVQMSASAHFDASSVRSKNALAAPGASVASQRVLGVGHASKANFSMVGATHSSAAVTAKSMGGILEKPAATANVTVLDDEGNDVTPISLTQTKSSHFKPSLMQGTDLFASAIKESVADVLNDLESMNLASWSSSQFGGGRRSASSSGRASDVSESDEKDTDSASGCSSGDSIDGRFLSATHRASADGVAKFGAASRREDDAGSTAHVHLLETGHVTLLAIPSLAVCSDFAEDAAAVRTANASYAQLCATKANNENFADRGMQTIGASRKNKDVQASGPAHASAECQVSLWELYDAYNDPSASRGPDAVSSADDPVVSALQSASVVQSNANNAALSQIITASDSIAGMRSNAAMSTRSFLANSMSVDGSESDRFSVVGRAVGSGAEGDSVMDRLTENGDREAALLATLNQESLKDSLRIMERAVVGNNYETKLIMYRNVQKPALALQLVGSKKVTDAEDGEMDEDIEEEEEEEEEEAYGANIPTLNALWSYRCDLTRGRSVAYLTWNKQNEDILAVAYGETKHAATPHLGLVLCWSLKNPEWPERIYRSSQPVTAIDFSKYTPNLLAVGYADGKIAIYDVRQSADVPVLDNNNIPGKHRDPVWELKWIEQPHNGVNDDEAKGEFLVSISTDGRVCQWQIHKSTLEHADLMVLKRVTKQTPEQQTTGGATGAPGGQAPRSGGSGAGHSKPAAFISRQAGGLCFDFSTKDKNSYLLGTEDGHIHRCSVSYNEQYLQTQFGHTGPVYKVKWSPFLPNVFLSCSADWTVRLWDMEEDASIFKFQSGKNGITDIAWSPTHSTIFSCVSNDGRLEVWDLKTSVLDPVIVHTVLDRQLTSIIFGSKSPCILIGDDSGAVSVFNIKIPKPVVGRKIEPEPTPEDQAALLENIIRNKGVDESTK